MSQEFTTQLEQLRYQFTASLPERVRRLEEIWSHLRHLNWSEQGIRVLQQFVHKLAGSGASFGFPELSLAAHNLDTYISDLLSLGRHFGGIELAQIEERIALLTKIMLNPNPVNIAAPYHPVDDNPGNAGHKLVFVVDPDRALAGLLCAYLRKAGFIVEYFETPQDCMQQLYLHSPQAILMDLDFERSGLHSLTLLQQMKALLPGQVPILLMSARTDLNAKLRALRAGSADYLTKPLDFTFLIEKLRNVINQHEKIHKVMIVDDDSAMSELQAEILRYAGMQVTCVNQPLLSLQRAAQFKPDLVILDMHMPDINGMELAILLRQDPEFLLLPIIFVTSDTDVQLHKNIKALGVNALLTKPIEANELINVCEQTLVNAAALKNRVARVTQRSQQPQQITRSYFFAALDNELQNNIIGKDLSALYYVSVTNLEELNVHLDKVELIDLHDQFCRHLSEIVGSDEQWVDLSTMVACVLAGKRSAHFHQQRCEQLTKYLCDQTYRIKGQPLPLHIKLGITYLNPALGTANNALIRAERAFDMSLAGSNAFAGKASDAKEQHDSPAATHLTQGTKLPDFSHIELSRDLALAFQPIISLEDPQIEHFSVLIRLRREDGELIPAAQFLNRLTQPGKRVELDRWVLENAVKAIADNSRTRENATLFIHLAAETLQQNAFFSFVANVLRSSRLRGTQRLVFMLEETWVINNIPHAQHIAKALQDIQCGLCLTRAGEHHNSIPLLNELAINYVRLSAALTFESEDKKPLLGFIKAATDKHIKVIATHIEDSQNLSSLWLQGVRLFEGFFIQPPDSGFHLQNDIVFAKEFVHSGGFNGHF